MREVQAIRSVPALQLGRGQIVCVYSVASLAKGFEVPAGTRLAIMDRGERQISFDPGIVSAAQWSQLRLKHAIRDRAHAMQYITKTLQTSVMTQPYVSRDGFDDIQCVIDLKVSCEDSQIDNVTQTFGEVDVAQALAKAVREPLEATIRRFDFGHIVIDEENLRRKANAECAPYGVRPELGIVRFLSRKHAALEGMRQTAVVESATTSAAEQLQRVRFEAQQKLAELAQHGKILEAQRLDMQRQLEHEIQLKELSRQEEVLTRINSILRKKEEAREEQRVQFDLHIAQMIDEVPRSPHDQIRHDLLRLMQQLRGKQAPFALDFQIANAGSERDIGVTRSHGRMQLGDRLRLRIQSARAGYLTILNFGTSGRVTLLFPNQFHRESFIPANTVIQIPSDQFDLPVGEPAGRELVKALVTPRPLANMAFVDGVLPFRQWEPALATRDIQVVANHLSTHGDWAEADIIIDTRL